MIEEVKKILREQYRDGIADAHNLDRAGAAVRLIERAEKLYQLFDIHLEEGPESDRPKVICLCGSTRFTEEMLVKQWELTKQGNIVLSWCALPDWYFAGEDKTHIGDQEGVKELVDEVHKRKIDLADEVLVIRAGKATGWQVGQPSRKFITYLGESTLSEMKYALDLGKPIDFYPPDKALHFNWNKVPRE